MSFLTNVLSIAQVTESSNNVEVTKRIKEQIVSIELEVKKYMRKVYLQKKSSSLNYNNLLAEISKCEEEINEVVNTTVQNTLYKINECTSESRAFQNDHKEALITLKTISALITIDKSLNEIKDNINRKCYEGASVSFRQIDELLNNKDLHLQSLDIFENIYFTYRNKYNYFIGDIEKLWCDNVKISEQNLSNFKIVEIAINTKECEMIHNFIKIFILHKHNTHIYRISKFFLNNILIPIIKSTTTLSLKQNDENYEVLQLKIDLCHEQVPTYTDVFTKIQQAFEFVGFINICLSENSCLFSEMALIIKKEFIECLVKDCLMQTIQSASSVTDSSFPEEIKAFQESLCIVGFFNDSDLAILEFAKDIDTHFANKECIKLLEKGREIMKKDLDHIIEVNSDDFNQSCIEKSSISPLLFPKCKISSNVKELQDLLLDILQKCGNSSNMLRERLLCTSCNIIGLYQHIVVVHHKNNLKSIPQQSAIFYNNCMYLAHWLLTVQKQMKLFHITQEESRIMLYLDHIFSLRLLGEKCLKQQLKMQKDIILERLRESDLNLISQVTKLKQTYEAISACINKIKDLDAVWYKVLPDNVFAKCIALLYNVLIEELIQRVCSAEDIPATVAEDLVNYFEIVQKSAFQSFKTHTEVMPRVHLWQKFQELKNVLKGNLESIESQWANGKGPLATVMERQEIKHLIRALFKNTDRRAELLMKIK